MERAAQALPVLKIVVVEDDNVVREFVKETVVGLGHQVVGEAANGTDMVRSVLELEPDVVVFDIHLPRMNGLDALRQIYQERIVAAVAITGDRDQDLVRRALEEHVLAYLVKPIEAHELGPALLVAWARFDELRQLVNENDSLKQNLENRKTIERAKGVLHEAAPLVRARGLPPPPARRHESPQHHGRTGSGRPQWPGDRAVGSRPPPHVYPPIRCDARGSRTPPGRAACAAWPFRGRWPGA